MKNLNKLLFIVIIFNFFNLNFAQAQIPGISIPGMGTNKNTSKVDLTANKSALVKTFFTSFENYGKALSYLSQSLGLDADSKKIEQAIVDSKNVNSSESDRMANSIKATSEVSKNIEAKLKDEKSSKLSVEAKVKYSQAMPFAAKGLIGTLELRPLSQQMASGIQANPMDAVNQLGTLFQVIPSVPGYITTILSVTKLIVTGAEANNIPTTDVKSALGKF
jgi:hypothetical protein